ncbi:MAG: NUDIX hydrolase [Spirochaetia bacterium]|jgi:8-oxo-dGTP pyrophosphatase MutT (NUDIX family)|nr:NUDIX hydrolase [Spirochaetia bacterium]
METDRFRIGNTEDPSHLVWKEVAHKDLLHTPIFDLQQDERESQQGVRGSFVTLKAPNWITIIPWYRNGKGIPCFVMVQQFRHGARKVIREFPAGIIDAGEDGLTAAKRELEEETGLAAQSFTFLADINPNPALMNNRAIVYLAEGLHQVTAQHLDATEQLDVQSVPVHEVIRQMGKDSLYDNGMMLMALGLFMREAANQPELLRQQ